MKVAFFDTHTFEREHFENSNARFSHSIDFFEPRLMQSTAKLAVGYEAVCSFANDKLDESTLTILKQGGVKLIALRSAGFNHVDLKAASAMGFVVVRVPNYSPYSVAEHAVALILGLNRKIYRAHNRVRDGNFSLNGLVGFDLHGKTVGIIGTGRIGSAFTRIMHGFGCKLLGYDMHPNSHLVEKYHLDYVSLSTLYSQSDIISLHVPLTKETRHLIDGEALAKMKKRVMLINTGRGALIDTRALVTALKRESIGYAGLDVYEEEEGLFFEDLSNQVIQDDTLARLMTFPNVLITAHQGFLTEEALTNIADTTLKNITDFENNQELTNQVQI